MTLEEIIGSDSYMGNNSSAIRADVNPYGGGLFR